MQTAIFHLYDTPVSDQAGHLVVAHGKFDCVLLKVVYWCHLLPLMTNCSAIETV